MIATSNTMNGLDDAIRDRFETYLFPNSPGWQKACLRRAKQAWFECVTQPFGIEPPDDGTLVSYATQGGEFTMRKLLTSVERKVNTLQHNASVSAGVRPTEETIRF